MLRVVPNSLLRPWFKGHVPGHADVPWDALGEREISPLLGFLAELLPSERKDVEVDLQNIRSFACEAGMAAINDTARLFDVHDLMSRVPEELDLNGRAMWIRLNEPEIFAASSTFLKLETCNYWRRRNDVPANLKFAGNVEEHLAIAIGNLLRDDGRGQNVTVERVTRDEMEYFIANPDDYVRCENTHDDSGNLKTIAIRPTVQIIMAYDRAVGSIELSTALQQPRKERIEQIFSEVALGWKLGPFDPNQAYLLDHLKDPTRTLATDPADNIRARIETISMLNPVTNRPLFTGIDRGNPEDTIHRAISEELVASNQQLWELRVKTVEIRFDFPATKFASGGHRKIRISPRTCNLRSLTPDRAEIVQKHLKLWEIDGAANDESGLASLGA